MRSTIRRPDCHLDVYGMQEDVVHRLVTHPASSSCHPLETLAEALQECALELHIGPHGTLCPSITVEGELLLLRRRAVDILNESDHLATWQWLWRAFFEERSPTLHPTVRPKQYLVDGHGRLLLICVSLLRQLLAPDARYPIVASPNASTNKLRLVRALRRLTTPGELRYVPVGPCGRGGKVDVEVPSEALDLLGRMVRVCLPDVQPVSHRVDETVPLRSLTGCIHFIMCTEVEDSALAVLRQLLIQFLSGRVHPPRHVAVSTVVARARMLMDASPAYVVPCDSGDIASSRALPEGIFLIPTVSAPLNAHHGAATPLFDLGYGEGQRHVALLLRIDDEGGLLDFAHSCGLRKSTVDDEDNVSADDCMCDAQPLREVEGQWTETEQHEAQLVAARILYEWAWANCVSVIITPSHAPPVLKTFGQRYSPGSYCDDAGDAAGSRSVAGSSIYMVDEVDVATFDAILRQLQYYHHTIQGERNDTLLCPTAAVLRRGALLLPDRSADALLPCSRLAYGSLIALSKSTTSHVGSQGRSSGKGRGLLLQLDSDFTRCLSRNREANVGEVGVMLLASPSVHQLRSYITLLHKCAASVLLAIGSSPRGTSSPEMSLGFTRAGGALQIALARQVLCSVKAMRQMDQANCGSCTSDCASIDKAVVVAVLEAVSTALLELPRRFSCCIANHNHRLRGAWLELESDELQCGQGSRVQSMVYVNDAPLHVYMREDPFFYSHYVSSTISPTLLPGRGAREYFCCSETESSVSSDSTDTLVTSEGSASEVFIVDEETSSPFSFIEPVASTTDTLRAALTMVRFILSSASAP
ncbi:hypothetical protein ERJ75_001650900 [Trypanosoma vivax]|nr:hypothetical protein TRVL_06027 [Trypanosoma vivax]KAH8605136.1 hypothetical protein ERJ75_001650900 [Trypanosoma vivax]